MTLVLDFVEQWEVRAVASPNNIRTGVRSDIMPASTNFPADHSARATLMTAATRQDFAATGSRGPCSMTIF